MTHVYSHEGIFVDIKLARPKSNQKMHQLEGADGGNIGSAGMSYKCKLCGDIVK